MSKLVLVPKLLLINIDLKVLSHKFFESEDLPWYFLDSISGQIVNKTEILDLAIAFVSVFAFPNSLKEYIDLVA